MSNTTRYYVIDRKEVEADSDSVYAKSTTDRRGARYWIRQATSGPDAGHLLNPWGINFQQGVDDRRINAFMGKRRYEYMQVSQEVFDIYLNFLETKNELYYRQAERARD